MAKPHLYIVRSDINEEQQQLTSLLNKYDGMLNLVAKDLGITQAVLYRKLKSYGITSYITKRRK